MHLSCIALIFALLFANVVQSITTTGFSAPLTKRKRPTPRSPLQGRTASAKFLPSILKRDEPLLDQDQDQGYTAEIQVGTPPKPYRVVLDTGSSDLFIAGLGCSNYEGKNPFDPQASSTFNNLQQDFSIQFGIGSADGIIVEDTVEWSGFNISKQVFAVATDISGPQVISGTADGLIGLALAGIAETKSTPFIEALFQNKQLPEPLFALYLARNINNTAAGNDSPGGQIDIGFTNTSIYSGNIDYSNVPSGLSDFWTIPLNGVSLSGQQLNLSTVNQTAMIDSGTTLITGPREDVDQIYAAIPGSQQTRDGWTIPCDTNVEIAFSFGTQTWPISTADFVIHGDAEGITCTGAIEGDDTSRSPYDWLLGDAFMKNVYTVFRFDPPSVGFAALGSGGTPSTSSSTGSNHSPSLSPPSSNSATPARTALQRLPLIASLFVIVWTIVI